MFTNVSWTTNATNLQAYFVFPFKMLSKTITTIKSSDYSVIVFLIINKRIHQETLLSCWKCQKARMYGYFIKYAVTSK